MSNFVSISQFKEAISQILEGDLSSPKRDRLTSVHQSAELFNATGDKITKLRLKFYIEDDGGDWTLDNLIKPNFIWDMKKIAGAAVIDSGNHAFHINLTSSNVKETTDGIKFIGKSKSFLVSSTIPNFIDGSKTLINLWFKPELLGIGNTSSLFQISGQTAKQPTIFSINLIENGGLLNFGLTYYQAGVKYNKIYSDTIIPNAYNNIQLLIDTNLSILVNGSAFVDTLSISLNPLSFTNIILKFGENYFGEISYITLHINNNVTSAMMDYQYTMRYPLPRDSELVDLSDEFELRGKNLFIDAGSISKAIETIKGEFFIKSNDITLRS
ncbi:MAG TPA: hypothetical protein VI815_02955 [Candidatus Nanoarchaeia archaeon]|nr:hypothetical protein [Candidatus Nanoarchaeia archaeon]